MIRHRIVAAVAFLFALLGAVAPAAADPRPDERVRQIMLARNAELRANLLKAWLVHPTAADERRLRTLIVDLYASEARLAALGLERPMMTKGVSLVEVPVFALTERTGVDLDPWAPFAGRTFAVPAELAR